MQKSSLEVWIFISQPQFEKFRPDAAGRSMVYGPVKRKRAVLATFENYCVLNANNQMVWRRGDRNSRPYGKSAALTLYRLVYPVILLFSKNLGEPAGARFCQD